MSIKKKETFDKILGPVSFGEMLNSLRLTEEISQVKFAKKLGISKSELCDIEKGRKFISSQKAVSFAKKLKDSPEVFVQFVLQDELRRAGLKGRVKVVQEPQSA